MKDEHLDRKNIENNKTVRVDETSQIIRRRQNRMSKMQPSADLSQYNHYIMNIDKSFGILMYINLS